jgi:hypothetical protein
MNTVKDNNLNPDVTKKKQKEQYDDSTRSNLPKNDFSFEAHKEE